MEGVRRVKMGSQGLEVSAQVLGCMGLSAFYGSRKHEQDMINLIHHAINSGVTFLNTSDFCDPKTNKILLDKERMREKVEFATKFGRREVNGAREYYGDPNYVRAACEAILERLCFDCIDL